MPRSSKRFCLLSLFDNSCSYCYCDTNAIINVDVVAHLHFRDQLTLSKLQLLIFVLMNVLCIVIFLYCGNYQLYACGSFWFFEQGILV